MEIEKAIDELYYLRLNQLNQLRELIADTHSPFMLSFYIKQVTLSFDIFIYSLFKFCVGLARTFILIKNKDKNDTEGCVSVVY